MARGGKRKGAGRKSGWNHSETTVIRVPKVFADRLTNIARQLDEGTYLDPEQKSKKSPSQLAILDDESVVFEIKESTVLSGASLSKRFGMNKSGVPNMKGRLEGDERKFFNWSKKKDPESIGWQYDEKTKKYSPVFEEG